MEVLEGEPVIVLFTDFGFNGPYLGQMKSVIWQHLPQIPIIDLFADAPVHNPRASAYLLASYVTDLPQDSVILSVVDPGVGTISREAAIVRADGRWYVGPDNGLFKVLSARAREFNAWHVHWRPDRLSASFHGRDLFAPLAVQLAVGKFPDEQLVEPVDIEKWPEDLYEIIYVDHFGNLITGIRAASVATNAALRIGERIIPRVRTFGDVPAGAPMCYENSSGLIEVAVNQGRATDALGLSVGSPVLLAG